MTHPVITIEGRTYPRNPGVDRYQIPYAELGSLRMKDVPRQSHVEVFGFPLSDSIAIEFYAVNGSSDTEPNLFIYGGPSLECKTVDEANRTAAKMTRLFSAYESRSRLNPIAIEDKRVYYHFSFDLTDKGDTKIRDILAPLVRLMRQLAEPTYRLFICHASEDKQKARSIARSLKALGNDVWLDEWEIQVGDSIVQKINEALASITHIVVLLSHTSCKKPWVAKEWSAALMRQLSDNSISVMPVRLDDCAIPPILADVRYADCRSGLRRGIAQIKRALQ